MKTYRVMWTFAGNYNNEPIEVQAESEIDAAKCASKGTGREFAKEATIHVFGPNGEYARFSDNFEKIENSTKKYR